MANTAFRSKVNLYVRRALNLGSYRLIQKEYSEFQVGFCYNNSVSTDRLKLESIIRGQETESCLIRLNFHWKHAVNKAVRRKYSSGTY